MGRKNHIIDVPDVEKIGVYAIYNSKTDKYYVGSSTNIKKRMCQHRCGIENLKHVNSKIMKDLKSKEDIKNFSFHVLETFENLQITDRQLRGRELYYYNLLEASKGYNSKQHKPTCTGKYLNGGLLVCQPGCIASRLSQDLSIYPSDRLMDIFLHLDSVTCNDGFYWKCKNEILRRCKYYDNRH